MSDEAQRCGSDASSHPATSEAAWANLADLRGRVFRIDDRLFMMREIPTQTPLTVDVLFDRMEELATGLDRFAYVVDLTDVKRPDAKTRQKLKERVFQINARLAHVGLAVGSNAVMRAVAKLVAFASGFRSFSFHESVEEATEACRRALR